MGSWAAGASVISWSSTHTAKLSGSTRIRGRAALRGISALDNRRGPLTATNRLPTPTLPARPASSAAGDTKAVEVDPAARAEAPNMGRARTGSGVGTDALASPICYRGVAAMTTFSDDHQLN